MALCIARSLAERGQFDPEDIAARFVEWYDSGPFDIGLMTADALRQIKSGVHGTRPDRRSGSNDRKNRMLAMEA